MQFSSRRFNDDHRAWVDDQGQRHAWLAGVAEGMRYDPRPVFDRTPHNPTNPILEWQRKTTRPGWAAVAARYVLDHWDATIGALPSLGIITYTPNMEQHARRVLTRVASFGERNR